MSSTRQRTTPAARPRSVDPVAAPAASAAAGAVRAPRRTSWLRSTLRRIGVWLRSLGPRGWRRNRDLDQRVAALRQFLARSPVSEESRTFLDAALRLHDGILGELGRQGVAGEFHVDWRSSVIAGLEREAARARHLERARASMRGPLPSTVEEERRVSELLGAGFPTAEEAARDRRELLADLQRLARDLGLGAR